jgi:Type II secretion system (T2SS), protein E, N-terminal domain
VSTDPVPGASIAGPGSGPALSGAGVTPPSLSGASGRFLSDILVELGFVDAAQAEHAVAAARNPGQTPEKVLLESGTITEDQLSRALAERYGLEHIDLDEFELDTSASALLKETAARRYLAAPVGFAADGALVLAVADPADSLGLSDIAVMTKLAVRPAVAARSQIAKLLDTLTFMAEPAPGASKPVSTVIVPPDDVDTDNGAAEDDAPLDAPAAPVAADADTERELTRLREELALALVARDEAVARATAQDQNAESAAEREREEALSALRAEHERLLAASEAAAEEALRAERASAQQALSALRAKHDEAIAELRSKHDEELTAERARRGEEVEEERGRTASAIDAERERNQKELEALRQRGEDAQAEERARVEELRAELEAAKEAAASAPPADAGRVEQLERELAQALEQVELTADADRRAETARAALAALRDESERQAQVHALTERELRAELEALRAELPETSKK